MDFSSLPDHSRVWVYQSNRPFTDEEVSEIRAFAQEFVQGWASHGNALTAGIEVRHNLFIIIAVDEAQAMASGCSIDKSVHFVKAMAHKYKVDLFDRMTIAYQSSHGLETATMLAFEQLLATGTLNETTLVFNNLVKDLAELKSKWQVPVHESWHQRLLPAQSR